jgi:hypothetical protein
MSTNEKINHGVFIISLGIIILNYLIIKINSILNTNLKLLMLINIGLVMEAYSYWMSRELG